MVLISKLPECHLLDFHAYTVSTDFYIAENPEK